MIYPRTKSCITSDKNNWNMEEFKSEMDFGLLIQFDQEVYNSSYTEFLGLREIN